MSANSVRVLGYLSAPAADQVNAEVGIADQRIDIEATAAQRRWGSVEFRVESRRDGYGQRSVLDAILDDLDAGHAGLLVVAGLEALPLSMLELSELIARSQRTGWYLVVLDIGIDTTTPVGQRLASTMASLAKNERRVVSNRTRSALASKRLRGERLGRPSRMPDDLRARIRTERAAGKTLRAISDGLNAEGVPTVRGGLAWYPSTVAAALKPIAIDEQI